MSDLLLDMSQSPLFRQAVKGLGLPLPTPQRLKRPKGPRVERPLQDLAVVVGGAGHLGPTLAHTLARAGANSHLAGIAADAAWTDAGEAFGRPPRAATDEVRAYALVFDATGLADGYDLRALYDFFHPWLPRLERCGRVVVCAREPSDLTRAAAAGAAAAPDGFTRSVAREIGRKGGAASVVFVGEGAEDRVEPLLRELLSDRTAFLTGQPYHLSADVPAPAAVPLVRPLGGRTVLVTGAARGIGAAAAEILAAEGAHVVCLDRPGDEGPLSQTARRVGGSVLAIDITADDAPRAIASALEGGVHAVIHNAGITRDKTLGRMSPEWWDQAVAVNFAAVVGINDALLSGPLSDGGRIVHLSSVSGIAGNVGQTNYSASKAGLVGYVRALSGAVSQRGIAVNAVAPGFIETRLTQAMPAVTREVARRLSALGQGGQPRDVAELLTFLCTPGASGLTGQTLRACGGMFIGA